MAIKKLNTNREIDVNPYLIEIIMDKINQLIEEIEWWKKARIIEHKEKSVPLRKAFDRLERCIDFDGDGVDLKKKVRKEKGLEI